MSKENDCPEIIYDTPEKVSLFSIERDGKQITLSKDEVDTFFEQVFNERCFSIDAKSVRWIDNLASIKALNTDGVIPGVIDLNTANKSNLAKFADLCYRLEKVFQNLYETVKSNRAQACKKIGYILQEDEEGDFKLTTASGASRANIKRSQDFIVSVKDQEKMVKWLKDNGFKDVLQNDYVHPKKLTSVIKQFVENGGALPDQDIVKCFNDPYAKVTKVYNVTNVWDSEIEETSTDKVEFGINF